MKRPVPSPTERVERKRAELAAFVAPHLSEGEYVRTGIAFASGPLPPIFPLVPVIGALAIMTPWYRCYGLVITSERVFLVRRSILRPGRPKRVELTVPLHGVVVARWTRGKVRFDVNGRRWRLYVPRQFADDIPAVLDALKGSST